MRVRKSTTSIRSRTTGKWSRTVHNDINRIATQIVEQFSPLCVILFGSYAQGLDDVDSDVDLLVVMPNETTSITSLDIRRSISYNIPLDVLVYSQCELDKRVAAGDFFLQDALETGKILYERSCK